MNQDEGTYKISCFVGSLGVDNCIQDVINQLDDEDQAFFGINQNKEEENEPIEVSLIHSLFLYNYMVG